MRDAFGAFGTAFATIAWLVMSIPACRGCEDADDDADDATATATPSASTLTASAPPSASASTPTPPPIGRCPREMVRVAHRLCVDRYEAQLIDAPTKTQLSPYYPPDKAKAKYLEELWQGLRLTEGGEKARAMPLPPLAPWRKQRTAEPKAISRRGVIPNAYVDGEQAAAACASAGKRLCEHSEWVTACRGEEDRDFPYGESYEQGQCNIFREGHPGIELYDNPSINHTDPRFNLITIKGKPLLRLTGATKTCASKWEDDAIYDMVGNLDEWVADPDGRFVGGFYARAKKDGCASSVSTHPLKYADYSTGVRCCRDVSFDEPPP